MKKIISVLLSVWILVSCSSNPSNPISEEQIINMIVKKGKLPLEKNATIDLANPYMVAELEKLHLEDEGYAKIKMQRSLHDPENMPLVTFTDKAKPYLKETVQKEDGIQQSLSTYTLDFSKVNRVKYNEEKTKAIVDFQLVYKNVTPFANLYLKKRNHVKEGQLESRRVYLSKEGDEWQLVEQPGAEFSNFKSEE
jgi:hypothetical protein